MKLPLTRWISVVTLVLQITFCYPQRIIETIAGNGLPGFGAGDGQPAISTAIFPLGIALDKNGNIYFSEALNGNRVRKIDHQTGLLSTVAGNGTPGFSGDGGPAIAAQLYDPRGIAIDQAGNLYVTEYWNHRVRKIDAITGIISTVAGDGLQHTKGEGGLATQASVFNPTDIAIDAKGNLYITALNNFCIRKVDATTGIISTVAGTFNGPGDSGDGSLATQAKMLFVISVVVDSHSNLYIADWSSNRVRKVDQTTGIITTIAGTGALGNSGDGGPATEASLYGPHAIEVDRAGNLYISETTNDFVNSKIRMVNSETGFISVVVGNGIHGFSGDGEPALNAQIKGPCHMVFDEDGNMYLADTYNYRIRKVTNFQYPKPNLVFADSCAGHESSFLIKSEVPVYKVHWDFGDGVTMDSQAPDTVHVYDENNNYNVRAVVISAEGSDSLEMQVNVLDCTCKVMLPNVFTPNGDTFNEKFSFGTNCQPEVFELTILNRWGKVIFRTKDFEEGWDGGDNSSGVYYYNATYQFKNLPVNMVKGTISLVR